MGLGMGENRAAHDVLTEDHNGRSYLDATTAVPVYICAIGGVELVTIFFGALPGLCGDCLLLFAMLNHYVLAHPSSIHREADTDARSWSIRALLVLALAPLVRILSLVMPLQGLPQIYWYAFIGVPLLVAALLTARHLNLSFASFGFSSPRWPLQIAIATSGLPLGLIAFFLVRPESLTPSFQWRGLAIGSVILVIFVGFTEELIFRTLLLHVAPTSGGQFRILRRFAGRMAIRTMKAPRNRHFRKALPVDPGIFWSSAVFAIMSIGSRSFLYVLFVGLIGVFFGWCVQRTGSTWGVVAAHSALVIGALLIFPYVFR